MQLETARKGVRIANLGAQAKIYENAEVLHGVEYEHKLLQIAVLKRAIGVEKNIIPKDVPDKSKYSAKLKLEADWEPCFVSDRDARFGPHEMESAVDQRTRSMVRKANRVKPATRDTLEDKLDKMTKMSKQLTMKG